VWWHLNDDSISWFWLNDIAACEFSAVSSKIVVLSEFVDTKNLESTSVGDQGLVGVDLITGQVSVSNELLSWLVDTK